MSITLPEGAHWVMDRLEATREGMAVYQIKK